MKKNVLNNKKILITGGTGSFGKAFVKYLYSQKDIKLSKVVIFSRDELKQYEMQNSPSFLNKSNLRFLIGDIRDYSRLEYALKDIDYVIHAAALKQVPAAEYNPYEYINTNVNGSNNLIRASINTDVKKIIALSTDKAAAPINLYGATKLCSDKLFVAANNIKGHKNISFSVVRYGNVMFSRGSVLLKFLKQREKGIFTITDKNMTRFNITLKQSTEMVMWALLNSKGSEIFVPKIPSYRILDLARAVDKNCKFRFIGLRPGEKLHEEMITLSDSYNTYDFGKYYAIIPNDGLIPYKNKKIKKIKNIFSYNSKDNNYLSVNELKKIINEKERIY
tara:strand:- start:31 stop:1032 length:1002 start_codon:yes stop_codon:yes gene_type:complete